MDVGRGGCGKGWDEGRAGYRKQQMLEEVDVGRNRYRKNWMFEGVDAESDGCGKK